MTEFFSIKIENVLGEYNLLTGRKNDEREVLKTDKKYVSKNLKAPFNTLLNMTKDELLQFHQIIRQIYKQYKSEGIPENNSGIDWLGINFKIREKVVDNRNIYPDSYKYNIVQLQYLDLVEGVLRGGISIKPLMKAKSSFRITFWEMPEKRPMVLFDTVGEDSEIDTKRFTGNVMIRKIDEITIKNPSAKSTYEVGDTIPKLTVSDGLGSIASVIFWDNANKPIDVKIGDHIDLVNFTFVDDPKYGKQLSSSKFSSYTTKK